MGLIAKPIKQAIQGDIIIIIIAIIFNPKGLSGWAVLKMIMRKKKINKKNYSNGAPTYTPYYFLQNTVKQLARQLKETPKIVIKKKTPKKCFPKCPTSYIYKRVAVNRPSIIDGTTSVRTLLNQ